ncbi:hypothetical protein VTJ49DRAFT_5034 [Mycothermus thermophilus]|uniref:Uncharacterized protein n=1 Tax=Humicola insolens TaxID=85995 RepID=A0ABR3V4M8_HUMIN
MQLSPSHHSAVRRHILSQLEPGLVHRLQGGGTKRQVLAVGLGTGEQNGDVAVVDRQHFVDRCRPADPYRISLFELRPSVRCQHDTQNRKGTRYVPPCWSADGRQTGKRLQVRPLNCQRAMSRSDEVLWCGAWVLLGWRKLGCRVLRLLYCLLCFRCHSQPNRHSTDGRAAPLYTPADRGSDAVHLHACGLTIHHRSSRPPFSSQAPTRYRIPDVPLGPSWFSATTCMACIRAGNSTNASPRIPACLSNGGRRWNHRVGAGAPWRDVTGHGVTAARALQAAGWLAVW